MTKQRMKPTKLGHCVHTANFYLWFFPED